jgi:hypothetical protein
MPYGRFYYVPQARQIYTNTLLSPLYRLLFFDVRYHAPIRWPTRAPLHAHVRVFPTSFPDFQVYSSIVSSLIRSLKTCLVSLGACACHVHT